MRVEYKTTWKGLEIYTIRLWWWWWSKRFLTIFFFVIISYLIVIYEGFSSTLSLSYCRHHHRWCWIFGMRNENWGLRKVNWDLFVLFGYHWRNRLTFLYIQNCNRNYLHLKLVHRRRRQMQTHSLYIIPSDVRKRTIFFIKTNLVLFLSRFYKKDATFLIF